MTDQFLNGDMEDSEFVNAYVKKRTETHTFKVKSEKMGDLNRDRQRGGGQASHSQAAMTHSIAPTQASATHRVPPPVQPPSYQGYTAAQSGPLPYPVPASTGGGWGAHTPYVSQPVAMPNPSSYYPR